ADRLGDRQRHLDLEVVALGLEHRGRLHARDDVEVAGRAAAATGLALAGQAHARAVLDAGRDVDPVALDGAHRTAALACRAGVVDDRPRAAALRARLGDREQPLALALDAATLAARAHARRRARLGAGARARRARRGRRHRQRHLRAV